MNSSKPRENQDPIQQLKMDAKHWHEQAPSEEHRENILQVIQEEFKMPRSRTVLTFPAIFPALTAAAILILGFGYMLHQSIQPIAQSQQAPIVVSTQQLEEDLNVLTSLPQLAEEVAASASLLEDPYISELNAIVEEMEATIQGLLELVEAS